MTSPLDSHPFFSATLDFEELPRAARRAVAQLAKTGRPHPNAELAAAAYTWARYELMYNRPRSVAGLLASNYLKMLGYELAGFSTEYAASQLLWPRSWKLAQRLMAIGPPETTDASQATSHTNDNPGDLTHDA